jgi:hypothetical protein
MGEFKINVRSDMTPEQIAREIGWRMRSEPVEPWGLTEYVTYLVLMPGAVLLALTSVGCAIYGLLHS